MYNDTGITIAYMINKYTINTNVNTAGQYSVQTNLQKYIDKAKKKPQNIRGGHNKQVVSNTTWQHKPDTILSHKNTKWQKQTPGSLPLTEHFLSWS